jgi:hypothetical protein
VVRRCLTVLLLAGCAATKPPEPEQPGQYDDAAQSAALDERTADLRWRPGDRKPVAREIVRTAPIAATSGVTPMTFGTVIRNRCDSPVAIAIGPADVRPTASDTLAAEEAILVGMTAEDWVHLRGASGEFHPANRVRWTGGPVVITCGSIVALEQ